jgi:transmembrane sensor
LADNKHIDNLIARYLSGEASDEERMKLERWMDESEVNKKYFGDICFVHEKVAASHKVVKVNIDKAWSNVSHQMKSPAAGKSSTIAVTPFRIPLWMRVAAVFIAVFGLSVLFYKVYLSSSGKAYKTYVVASSNSTLNYKLTDSTQVILSKHSQITYNSQYGKKQREVSLSGEAYFNILHDTAKPFIVKAEEVLVKDLGTSFNIKAFPDSSVIEVSVESGNVVFYTAANPGIMLNRGETGVFEKTTRTFRKHVTVKNKISGHNRFFIFQNARLSDVIEQLNIIYQTNIRLGNDNLSKCKITVTFDNEEIGSIVGIIAETLSLRMVKTNDGYLLEGNSCPSQ